MLNVIKKLRDLYPLALAKIQSGEIISDCVFNHHTCTPWSLVDDFWDKQFDTFATVNFEALLHPNILNTRYVQFYTSCSIKASYAKMFLEKLKLTNPMFDYTIVKYTYDFTVGKVVFLMENSMIEFHGIFLNSPYSIQTGKSTKTKPLYPDFNRKFKPMATINFGTITPRTWASMPGDSFKAEMFSTNNLKELVCLDNNTFKNAQTNTCYAIFDMTKSYPTTTVVDESKRIVSLQLDETTVIPWGDVRWASIFDKIKKHPTLDSWWTRGKLNLKEIVHDPNGIEFITNVGKTGKQIDTIKIKPTLESHGYGKVKVCFANVGGEGTIGPVKISGRDTVFGHSVVGMFVEDKDENIAMLKAFRLKEYIESSFAKKIIQAKKTSTPNAKHVFEYLPVPDLTADIDFTKIFDQLNFDQSERALFND
jgi:hypothetical protein